MALDMVGESPYATAIEAWLYDESTPIFCIWVRPALLTEEQLEDTINTGFYRVLCTRSLEISSVDMDGRQISAPLKILKQAIADAIERRFTPISGGEHIGGGVYRFSGRLSLSD